MTFGDKLSKLRKEKNYTQEQLADILGVSRQAISKWESNTAYPETEKVIRISGLFGCSLDYLFREEIETEGAVQPENIGSVSDGKRREKKSKKIFMGLPLYHIGKNARGVVAIGMNARGIVAIGMKARGIISLGLLSMGVFSFGAISLGIVSVGAIAVGDFSVGALAIGKYFAYGDNARGMIAIGITEASGSVYQKLGEMSAQEWDSVKGMLDSVVPGWLSWAKEIIKLFMT